MIFAWRAALAVAHGNEIIELINSLMKHFNIVVLTQDERSKGQYFLPQAV